MTFLDEALVKEIGDEARRVEFAAVAGRFGRLLLTILAALLYATGWIVRKLFVVGWLAITWSWAAVRLGWREAAPNTAPNPRP